MDQQRELLKNATALLQSGDDAGCDGLVCVGLDEFLALRRLVHDMTGHWYGSVAEYEKGEDDE
jgi:hypothetical protein